ncbi:MAG: monofunctional biosynthetic peptidoglycan transglycosylase [Pseudomonadota bacterium]|jgi:monofunctional biosynthetic peptidoglycan transglycosylase
MAGRSTRWWIRIALMLIGVFLGIQLWFFGWVLIWRVTEPGLTQFMRIRLEELQRKNPAARLQHQWVPYGQISVHLKRALIAAEDSKFMQHQGFDIDGIQKAIEKNEKRGHIAAGGSTITQQLAKNLFLWPEKSFVRKGEEALITLMIEATWSKRRILEVYMNEIEWGTGIFGAEAAARHYFGISASELSPAQAAMLASIVPSPQYYDLKGETEGLIRQTDVILERMNKVAIPANR